MMLRLILLALLASAVLGSPVLQKRLSLTFSWRNGSVTEDQRAGTAELLTNVIEPVSVVYHHVR